MFADKLPDVRYADPWIVGFEERLARLKSRPIRVAYYYEQPDSSTFRYRVYNMVQVLNRCTRDVSAAWFCRADMDELDRALDAADVLVVCRARYEHRLNALIIGARTRDCEVVYDVDDLVFDPDYIHLVVHTLDQDLLHPNVWDWWFAYIGRQAATMRLCDRAIVTNSYIAARARQMGLADVRVVPNFLNQEQIEISHRIFQAKRAARFASDGRIHLGYFSGTPSHNRDFGIMAGALDRLLAEVPRLRLCLVGFLDLKGRLERHHDQIERYPLQDFLNLQRLIGSTEINLVPLQDNIFTHCKSELKYFEAGIVGTVTVASPTRAYEAAICDGVNGWLANEHEWEAKLRIAIEELTGGATRYIAMAERAAAHSLECYRWERQVEAVRAALFGPPPKLDETAYPTPKRACAE